MLKPRILMTNEASVLNTGYSVYGKEVLQRLYQSGKYEIAELACYVKPSDNRMKSVPWKVYYNVPEADNTAYDQNPVNEFGEWSFNDVCLDFRPHIVFDIRDYWMQTFLGESPFRRFYNLAVLAPVDGIPQNEQWIDFYNDADAVFTYTDWGGRILKEHCNRINFINPAQPIASTDFFPIPEYDKQQIKANLGLGEYSIVGTVMRNQRRKLFPDLFNTFRRYLDVSKDTKTLLYCHTAYPDLGWEIPKLLIQNGISNRVIFTYVCNDERCKHIAPSFYSGQVIICHKCGQLSMTTPGTHVGAENPVLNFVYNIMDLYIQYACNEGFGMPVLEAASCGTPVTAVDYSAMSENVEKLNGYLIKVHTLQTDVESGIKRAVPNDDSLLEILLNFTKLSPEEKLQKRKETRRLFNEKYESWDITAKKWMDYFDTVDIQKYEDLWKSPKKLHNPLQPEDRPYTNTEFVNWLMVNTLGQPEKIGSYMAARLIRDLNACNTTSPGSDRYFADESLNGGHRIRRYPFNRQNAYNNCVWLCNKRNEWENKR